MKKLILLLLLSLALLILAGCNLMPLFGTGSVSGTVTNQANQPLEQVCITVNNQKVFTNAQGYYTLANLTAGTYALTAEKEGYTKYEQNITITMGSVSTVNITMVATSTTPTGSLKGVVRDENNVVLQGVTVTVGALSALTDAQGFYNFANITPGIYTLTANKSGYTTYSSQVEIAASVIKEVNISLYPTSTVNYGSLKGKVGNQNNVALSGVTVTLGASSLQTDAQGFYNFTNIVPGTYTLTASKSVYSTYSSSVTIEAGVVKEVNISLIPVSSGLGNLSGIVVDSNTNAPLQGVTVTFGTYNILTNQDGIFSITSITPGTYSLTTTMNGYNSHSETISIVADTTKQVNIAMVPVATVGRGNITGLVFDTLTYAPIVGATVTVDTQSCQTDSGGKYYFYDIEEGIKTVTASKGGYNSISQAVEVTANNTAILDAPMVSTEYGQAYGYVQNYVNGEYLVGATVSFGNQTYTTDSTGKYITGLLAKGTYTVTASMNGFSTFTDNVTIVPGSHTSYSIVMQPVATNGVLKGYVTNERGGPAVSGATVTYSGSTTTTDASGYFEMAAPANITADVMIQAPTFGTARIQNVTIESDGEAYFEVPVRKTFNPRWSLNPPTINVNGAVPGQTVSGTVTLNVLIQGDNTTNSYFIYVGGEHDTPSDSGYQWDTAYPMIDTTRYPNGPSVVRFLVYDANYNTTILCFPMVIQNAGYDSQPPTNILAMDVYSFTFGQKVSLFRSNRAENFKLMNLANDPYVFELSTGRKIDLRSFEGDGTLYNLLYWDGVGAATGYTIYRSFDAITYKKVGDISASPYTTTMYFYDCSSVLTPNTKTYYKVVPYNSYGNGPATVVDVTPLPPFNVALLSPANNTTDVVLNPTFNWIQQSYYTFPLGTTINYYFSLFDAAHNLSLSRWVDTLSYTLDGYLEPNKVYSWDIYDGYAEYVTRDDETGTSMAQSVIGVGAGSTNGEYIFRTTTGY